MSRQTTSQTFTEIPKLDLSLADTNKDLLLSQLRHALTEVGFLYITNYGVPEDVISDLVNILPALFSLPDEVKEQVSLHNSPHFLGYSGDGSETTAGKTDRREQFEFATELSETWTPENGESLYERLRGPNQWPPSPPTLRPIIQSYITQLTLLGERFLRLVAQALNLPPETFHPFLSDQHRLKLVRYPPISSPSSSPTPGMEDTTTQGVGPHKDSSGWWTFLLQASPPPIGGLQALNKRGEWIDVPPVPRTFVVNIGQAFEVVTNGVCKATTHRVVLGRSETLGRERFSVPFFQGVRRDLTRREAVGTLKGWAGGWVANVGNGEEEEGSGGDSGREIDSAFLKGKYDTWGESQLRTKVRSHRDVGRRFYGDVFEVYVCDDL